MKREEFEEKFKVGDTIIRGGLPVVIISYEGDKDHKFSGKCEGIVSGKFSINDRWKLYKEPIKKDLESIFEIYQISKQDELLSVTKFLGNAAELKFQQQRAKNSKGLEYITKEEAIERGLKID